MVGHWVDESGNNKVESNVRWADNNSYLIRTYTVDIQGEKPTSGTHVHRLGPPDRPDQVVDLRLRGGPRRGPLDPHRARTSGSSRPRA